jgi:CDP-diacylglycerol--serine O-phosphatidyltransferase
MVFDALDGWTARLFKAASMRGLQMDSLADMVTFGVAPAVVVAVMAHKMKELQGGAYYFVWVMCAIYLACAAFRLATYNVHAMVEQKSTDKFDGLPSPGAAAAVCSLVIFFNATHAEHMVLITVLPVYAGLLGLLMVSKIRYQHMGKWLQSVRRNNRRMLSFILFLSLFFVFNPIYVAVVAINMYIISGPVGAFFRLFTKRDVALLPEDETVDAKA